MNEQLQNDQPKEDQPEGIVPPIPGGQPPEVPPARKFKLTWKFGIGFLGWYLVIGLVFWIVNGNTFDTSHGSEGVLLSNLCIFPGQIVILIVLLTVRQLRELGWGMLSALGMNFVISLILGLFSGAICFIPFFFGVD